jgi:hypothetical protein
MVIKNEWTDEQIVEWVTIIAIFLFACFPYEMIYLSETSLGKLFFVFIIIYYAMVDPIYGVIACSIVIVYYQLDLYKSFVAIHRDTLLSENMMMMEDSIIQNSLSGKRGLYSDVTGLLETFDYTGSDMGTLSLSSNLYESEFLKGSRKQELLNNFRKQNCDSNGALKMNSVRVPHEMTDHVFREIQFPNNSSKCNPCNESCEFSIIEERINREENLRPVSSKDEAIDWNKFFGHYLVTPMTNIVNDFYLIEQKVANFIGSK